MPSTGKSIARMACHLAREKTHKTRRFGPRHEVLVAFFLAHRGTGNHRLLTVETVGISHSRWMKAAAIYLRWVSFAYLTLDGWKGLPPPAAYSRQRRCPRRQACYRCPIGPTETRSSRCTPPHMPHSCVSCERAREKGAGKRRAASRGWGCVRSL